MSADHGQLKGSQPIVVAAAFLALAVCGIVALFSPETNINVISCALVIFVIVGMLYAMRRRLAPPFMSPVVVVSVGMLAMALLGSAFFADVQDARYGASAAIELSPEDSIRTFWLMSISAGSVVFGAALTLFTLPRVQRPPVAMAVGKNLHGPLLLGCFALVAAQLFAGGAELWSRSRYIEEAVGDGGLIGLISQLAIGAIIALGYLSAAGSPAVRLGAAVAMVGYLTVFFGSGSRKIAMVPILFAVGFAVARKGKGVVPALVVAASLAFFALRLPLYLRSLPQHGVIPYLQSFPGFLEYSATWESIAKNLLVSFGIIGATAYQQPQIPSDVFWVSINPAPGSIAGWYDEAAGLRINAYTPYAAVGELGNYGFSYVVGYYIVAGVILAVLDRITTRLVAHGRGLLGLALLGLSGLFILYSFQYNLRSSTRMLLYALIAAFVLTWLDRQLNARATLDTQQLRSHQRLRRSDQAHQERAAKHASYRSMPRSSQRPQSSRIQRSRR